MVMQFLKWFGFSLLGLVIGTYIYLYVRDLYDDRPFKFEHYKSSADFETGLRKMFPLGSNIEKALQSLHQSGAKCKIYDDRNKPEEKNKYSISCVYNTGWVTLYPLEHYRLFIDADINLKIIQYWTERTKGFVI